LSKIAITADQKAPLQFVPEELPHPRCADQKSSKMVELTGIEPATYGLQSRRSPS
jgi:hypothetical protein